DVGSGVKRSLEDGHRVSGDARALDGTALADHLDFDAAGLAHRVSLLGANPGRGHDDALLGEVLADGAAGRAGRRVLADAEVWREEAGRHGAPRLGDLAGEDVEAGDAVLATGGRERVIARRQREEIALPRQRHEDLRAGAEKRQLGIARATLAAEEGEELVGADRRGHERVERRLDPG